VRIPGSSEALAASEVARPRLTCFTRMPVVGIVAIAALMVGPVDAAPGRATLVHDAGIRPLAAVATSHGDGTGATQVTATRPPTSSEFAATKVSAPPPAVVSSPGALGIPAIALAAYRNAELLMAVADPACGVSWNLLAGIGRIESTHANGGATDARGNAVPPIFGPLLDGSLPGNEIIVESHGPDSVQYARALGPMQFLPGTWARFASDGNGDGKADVQNIFDAALAAARYLCSGGLNLRDPMQTIAAILRYNNSMPYVENVLAWAAAYAAGAVPVDLPPIIGPVPPIGDAHLDGGAPEAIGPGLPVIAQGIGPGLLVNAISPPAADPVPLLPVPSGGTDSPNDVDPGALAAGSPQVTTHDRDQSVMAPKPVTAPLPAPVSASSQEPVPAAFARSPVRAQIGGPQLLSGGTQPLRGVQAVGSVPGRFAQPLHAGSSTPLHAASPKRR
jgi:membrane-bound lytic murein transglycosylase B